MNREIPVVHFLTEIAMEKKEELTLRPEIEVNYRDRWPIRRTNEKSLQSLNRVQNSSDIALLVSEFDRDPFIIDLRADDLHAEAWSRNRVFLSSRFHRTLDSIKDRRNEGSRFDLPEILLNLINLIESYSRGWSFFRYLMDDRFTIVEISRATNTQLIPARTYWRFSD